MLYQGETDKGLEVRCDTNGNNGYFCVKWE